MHATTTCGVIDPKFIGWFCINGNINAKAYDIYQFNDDGSSTIIRTDYFDLNNNLIPILPGYSITEGDCVGKKEFDAQLTCVLENTQIYMLKRDEQTNEFKVFDLSTNPATDVTGTVSPVKCEDKELESDPESYCVDSVDYTLWIVKVDGVPNGQTYWTNAAGTVVGDPLPTATVANKGICMIPIKKLTAVLPGCLITTGGGTTSLNLEGYDFDITDPNNYGPGFDITNVWLTEAQLPTAQVWNSGVPNDPSNMLLMLDQNVIQNFIDTWVINEHNNSYGQSLVVGDIVYIVNADNTATLRVKPGTDISWNFVFSDDINNFGNRKFNATLPTTHTLPSIGLVKKDIQIEKYDTGGVVTEELWLADFTTNPVTRTLYIPAPGDIVHAAACPLVTLPYDKVIDGQILSSIPGGSVTYSFTSPVADIDIYNDSDGVAMITYNNAIPTLGNNTSPIASGQSITFNAKDETQLISSVTIVDVDSTRPSRYLIKGVRL